MELDETIKRLRTKIKHDQAELRQLEGLQAAQNLGKDGQSLTASTAAPSSDSPTFGLERNRSPIMGETFEQAVEQQRCDFDSDSEAGVAASEAELNRWQYQQSGQHLLESDNEVELENDELESGSLGCLEVNNNFSKLIGYFS
jgi:hypothetical protein